MHSAAGDDADLTAGTVVSTSTVQNHGGAQYSILVLEKITASLRCKYRLYLANTVLGIPSFVRGSGDSLAFRGDVVASVCGSTPS